MVDGMSELLEFVGAMVAWLAIGGGVYWLIDRMILWWITR